jgi:hypothetical protein
MHGHCDIYLGNPPLLELKHLYHYPLYFLLVCILAISYFIYYIALLN